MSAHVTRQRTVITALIAVLAMLLPIALTAAPAQAATAGTIDSVDFVKDEFPGGSTQEIKVKWSAPDNPSTPLTISIDLPPELQGITDSFPMTGADGKKAGTCQVTKTTITCTVDDDYVKANPLDLSGEFSFQSRVLTYNDTTIEKTFDFGNVTSPAVTITPDPQVCVENCEFPGQKSLKYGRYNNDKDEITWQIDLPAPKDGIAPGKTISVRDVIDTSAFEVVGTPVVREARSIRYDTKLKRELPNFADMPADLVTVSADKQTIEFVSRPGLKDGQAGPNTRGMTGSVYAILITVKVLDQGAAGKYTNIAEYTIEGEQTKTVKGDATRYGGSGSVVGTNAGKVAVKKLVTGDAVIETMPDFTLEWTAYDTAKPGDSGTKGSTKIKAGGTFTSKEYPRGTRLVITEVTPTGPDSVTWKKPKFVATDASGTPVPGAEPSETIDITFDSANGNLGKMSYFSLTNEATVDKGTFEAKKVIENPDGLDLSGIDDFVLDYTYPAGSTFPAGSGSLTLPADGTSVTSPELPVGAELSLSEQSPANVPGGTWESSVVSPKTLVIGKDTSAQVEVTNRITKDVGAFSVQKSVSGTGSDLVSDGTEFEVKWSHPAGDGFEAASGTITVTAGGDPVTVEGLPVGAEVTLTEAAPSPIDGGKWLDPKFSKSTFTIVKDQTVTIDLDNPIDLSSGDFEIAKAIDGDGADLVDPQTTFGVDYSYPAGKGFEAGSGTLTVTADGTAVSSGPLPYGATVTLKETAVPVVPGGTWTGHRFDPETITIGDGTTVKVTLTNTIEKDQGGFSLRKSVDGAGADLVPADTEFEFTYSYPGGETFPAGEGTLTVRADGTAVSVDSLPAGAVVTLAEAEPKPVPGATWTALTFDGPNPLVIGKDEVAEVRATNTLTPDEPDDDATADDDSDSGSDGTDSGSDSDSGSDGSDSGSEGSDSGTSADSDAGSTGSDAGADGSDKGTDAGAGADGSASGAGANGSAKGTDAGGKLPRTGADGIVTAAVIAGLLLALGAAAVIITRRRRNSSE